MQSDSTILSLITHYDPQHKPMCYTGKYQVGRNIRGRPIQSAQSFQITATSRYDAICKVREMNPLFNVIELQEVD